MPATTKLPKAEKTRHDIVRAAEKLFAEKGFRSMTLRDVTREAHVNLAAVNYHFGSKRELMLAVIHARFEPINTERLKRLDGLVAQYSPAPVPLELIFGALFRPLFEGTHKDGHHGHHGLIAVIGRALTEPADFVRTLHKEFFAELSRRFMVELKRSCPGLSDEALQYRFFFTISTMIGTITEKGRLENMSGGKLDSANSERMAEQLIHFAVAGFKQSDSCA
jgi:AcrR family transcriptional regulator